MLQPGHRLGPPGAALRHGRGPRRRRRGGAARCIAGTLPSEAVAEGALARRPCLAEVHFPRWFFAGARARDARGPRSGHRRHTSHAQAQLVEPPRIGRRLARPRGRCHGALAAPAAALRRTAARGLAPHGGPRRRLRRVPRLVAATARQRTRRGAASTDRRGVALWELLAKRRRRGEPLERQPAQRVGRLGAGLGSAARVRRERPGGGGAMPPRLDRQLVGGRTLQLGCRRDGLAGGRRRPPHPAGARARSHGGPGRLVRRAHR
mmetsp:Transcript_22903/g.78021  ORF Transcript_22903/g.78021 Transcript_22903/m.78021 type:complete len:264 (-) Transcript_22903:67-858(-)